MKRKATESQYHVSLYLAPLATWLLSVILSLYLAPHPLRAATLVYTVHVDSGRKCNIPKFLAFAVV